MIMSECRSLILQRQLLTCNESRMKACKLPIRQQAAKVVGYDELQTGEEHMGNEQSIWLDVKVITKARFEVI